MATKRARITERNPLTATDGVIAGYEQVNKSASLNSEMEDRQDDQLTSQQVNNLTSQQFDKPTSQNELGNLYSDSDNTTTEEVGKPTSQLVEKSIPTSQEPDNLTSQEVNKLDLSSSQSELGKSASQQPEKLAIQQADNIESQQVSKPTIRKATFQVDAAILEALDQYHLQLQIEMGRRNAPYKEILVEEAIAQWLERATKSPERAVKSLLKRQEQR